jgi:redox-sensitive bicupin YhaK (pirin superfamily)
MITVRNPETIYQASGQIQNGTFHGRWHFSFEEYYDPEYTHFGALRLFNDDTLSSGAVWPLHPHSRVGRSKNQGGSRTDPGSKKRCRASGLV